MHPFPAAAAAAQRQVILRAACPAGTALGATGPLQPPLLVPPRLQEVLLPVSQLIIPYKEVFGKLVQNNSPNATRRN